MICVKLSCSCIIALLHRWQILRWSENAVIVFLPFFPTFPNTKCSTIHPPPWLPAAHQRRLAELPQLFHNERQVVHRDERPAVLGAPESLVGLQDSAPQRLGLGEGAAVLQRVRQPQPWIATGAEKFPTAPWGREGTFFHYLWCRGIFLDPNLWWENEILGFELFWFHLSSCYRLYRLMLSDACCKYCCLLQSMALLLQLCGISGCRSAVTRQYSSWLNNTCLLMCLSLWRDWGPHRFSAKSALSCSGPNLSAVASARHRSLGHDDAYHMAVPITWQCGSRPCHQHGRQIKFKRMANGTQNRQGVGRLPASVRSWLLGCNRWPLLCGIFNHMFLRVRVGEARFFEIGRRLS